MAQIDYKQAGVDYEKIDPLKILAQQAAAATAGNLQRHGMREVAASRGESAYLVECGDLSLASITECLGTKALVADATRTITGRTYYELIAQDTLAMAINDLITVGATPLSVHAYWAAGGSAWFDDAQRAMDARPKSHDYHYRPSSIRDLLSPYLRVSVRRGYNQFADGAVRERLKHACSPEQSQQLDHRRDQPHRYHYRHH